MVDVKAMKREITAFIEKAVDSDEAIVKAMYFVMIHPDYAEGMVDDIDDDDGDYDDGENDDGA